MLTLFAALITFIPDLFLDVFMAPAFSQVVCKCNVTRPQGELLFTHCLQNTVYICKRGRLALSPLLFTAFHTNAVNKLRPGGIECFKQTNSLTCHLVLALALFTAGFGAKAAGCFSLSASVWVFLVDCPLLILSDIFCFSKCGNLVNSLVCVKSRK